MKHCVFNSLVRPSAPISMTKPDGFTFAGTSSSCCYSIVNAGHHGSSRSPSSAGGIHTSRRECCVLVGLSWGSYREQILPLMASYATVVVAIRRH